MGNVARASPGCTKAQKVELRGGIWTPIEGATGGITPHARPSGGLGCSRESNINRQFKWHAHLKATALGKLGLGRDRAIKRHWKNGILFGKRRKHALHQSPQVRAMTRGQILLLERVIF